MNYFLDIYDQSLNKTGEELCGDTAKVVKTDDKTIVVLSDGMGSGVKASILSTLTTEIIVTMTRADVPLPEVIATVIGTLPVCKVRKVAYATFTIVEIDHTTNQFQIINFDNPPILYFQRGKLSHPKSKVTDILGKRVNMCEGQLAKGDFIGLLSDGVLHAGLGTSWNFGWGWDNVADHMEGLFTRALRGAKPVVRDVIGKTLKLYGANVGDDATFVGIFARERHSLIVFTGPPLDDDSDDLYIQRLLDYDGRKVVCGGTTGNIVANYLSQTLETDISTMRRDVPPIGKIMGIDLVTEGIVTMSRALEYMKDCGGEVGLLPQDNNGAILLARELLTADAIFFLVGQKINEFYQNPLLPKNLSIRKNLVEEIAQFLRTCKKETRIEYC
ncbi:MAG: SpoIIE family protein phosphatase [Anaerolineae bacterium]